VASPHDCVREVLNGIDRLSVAADQHAEVGPGARDRDDLVVLLDVDPSSDTDPVHDPRHESSRLRGQLGLVDRLRHCSARRDRRDDLRRRETDPEQTSLALGHDLEVHGRLVQARVLLLELSKRSPLGLADRLAGRLDRDLLRFHF